MAENKISKRHKRLLSSLFFVLEQKIESIEHMIHHTPDNAAYSIKQDLKEYEFHALTENCTQLKNTIREVAMELDLPKRNISQYQYVSTIQSQMWENISDAFSDKLHGYGKNMVSNAKSVDPLIQKIAHEIDNLRL